MNTLLLDLVNWDLVLDINGNWAMASDPYSQAQDAASECKLFSGELWYDTSRGIPYFQNIIGKLPPLTLVKTYYTQAVLNNVPGVVSAQAFIAQLSPQRVFSGQIQITNSAGQKAAAGF
jgi:hypothetical protein